MEKEQINDGGPAFPVPSDVSQAHYGVPDGYLGMTLRDWFAGQALSAILLASLQGHTRSTSIPRSPLGPEDYALAAYKNADAMLEAREKL